MTQGSVLVYRVFDIAEEIDLAQAALCIAQLSPEKRLKLNRRGGTHSVIIRNAPLMVDLGEAELGIPGIDGKATLAGKIWDYGTLSVSMSFPLSDTLSISDLVALSAQLQNSPQVIQAVDQICLEKRNQVSQMIAAALKLPSEWHTSEDYVIFQFTKPISLTDRTTSALLWGEENETIAEVAHDQIVAQALQYSTQDLVLIDWNSAIIVEPTQNSDIADVIEFALTHLLEVRYYDDLLDKRLQELYDKIENQRNSIFGNQYAKVSKDANRRYIEFSEFMERIDNSLKGVGDFYLARVFRQAMRRFRIEDWQGSITRKMNLLARVSELLQGEVNVLRSHWLEITVIVLITFEILSAILKAKT